MMRTQGDAAGRGREAPTPPTPKGRLARSLTLSGVLLVGVLLAGVAVVGTSLSAAAGESGALADGRSQSTEAPSYTFLPRLTPAERIEGLSIVWHQAIYNYPFWDRVPRERWDSAYSALVPKVLETNGTIEYYDLLLHFVALLEDGHSNVFPPADILEQRIWGQPPVALRAVGERAIVGNVDRELAERLPIGSEIVAVDGRPVAEVLREDVFPFLSAGNERSLRAMGIPGSLYFGKGLLVGRRGTSVTVLAKTPEGDSVELELRRSREGAEWSRSAPTRPILEHRTLPGRFAYVALNTFRDDSIVGRFDAIAEELRGARGVVLDLRRNGGGKIRLGVDIARRHLAIETLIGYAWSSRIHGPVFAANGEYLSRWFAENHDLVYRDGDIWFESPGDTVAPDPTIPKVDLPVAVLIGPATASSAESFVVLLEGDPRFVTVGEPTFGSTGMGLSFSLPGGGSGRIVSEVDTYPDGRVFVGPGIQPDILVEPTIRDLMKDRDPVLERALEVLRERTGG